MNKVNSKIIEQLHQYDNFPVWSRRGLIPIPFIGKIELLVIFKDYIPEQDSEFLDGADRALVKFLELSSFELIFLSNPVLKNCTDIQDNVESLESDEQFKALSSEQAIWKYVHRKEIYVTRRSYNDYYIQIACECDLEQEHGFQLVFRQGIN